MFPIYIPSKGRAGTATTPKLLAASGLSFNLVVEPQDYNLYSRWIATNPSSEFVTLLCLPKNNQGLAYSRNWCKSHSIARGDKFHWQMDDDIKSFMHRMKGRRVQHILASCATAAVEAELAKYTNIGQAGFNQNSWPPGDLPFQFNKIPVQAVLNNNSVADTYRIELPPLEDIDFTLRMLRSGWCSLMFDHYRTNCPAIGTLAGGLKNIYDNQSMMFASMQKIVKEFPVMSIDKDENGWHLCRNRILSTFKHRPIMKPPPRKV